MIPIYLLLSLIILISLFLVSTVYVEPFTQTDAELFSRFQKDSSPSITHKKYDLNVDTPDYHTDPSNDASNTTNNLEFGYVWIQDKNGKLAATKLDVIQNKTLYYPFGLDRPNPPPFVPNYEESVWLSRMSNPQFKSNDRVYSLLRPYNDDTRGNTDPYMYKPLNMNKIDPANICNATEGSIINREFECSKLNKDACQASGCCISLGENRCAPNMLYNPA